MKEGKFLCPSTGDDKFGLPRSPPQLAQSAILDGALVPPICEDGRSCPRSSANAVSWRKWSRSSARPPPATHSANRLSTAYRHYLVLRRTRDDLHAATALLLDCRHRRGLFVSQVPEISRTAPRHVMNSLSDGVSTNFLPALLAGISINFKIAAL